MPPVIVKICLEKGHHIQSQVIGDFIDPVFKVVVHKYEFRCTQCGKTLAEINKYNPGGAPKLRKAKPHDNHSNSAGTSAVAEGPTETSEAQSMDGTQSDLPEPGVQQDPTSQSRGE
jgi:hypothetical protein